jgi:hypothetical protein
MLGLVRVASLNPFQLTRNHQVMAYGYDLTDEAVSLCIYDPNHGPRDDVRIDIRLTPDRRDVDALTQSTGEPLEALFRAPYSARDPVPWR